MNLPPRDDGDETSRTEEVAMAPEEEILPREEALLPREEHFLPREEEKDPYDEEMLGRYEVNLPPQEEKLPHDEEMLGRYEVSLPPQEEKDPHDEEMLGRHEVTLPPQEENLRKHEGSIRKLLIPGGQAERGDDPFSGCIDESMDSRRPASLPVPGATTRLEAIGAWRQEMNAWRFRHECPAAGDRCLTPQTSTSGGSDMNEAARTHRCPGAQTSMSPVPP